MDYRVEFNKSSENFKREKLRKVLKRCTSKQQDIFNRMYGSIEIIEEKKMTWAYQQVMSSLTKNQLNQ